jgi:hypothetical protein
MAGGAGIRRSLVALTALALMASAGAGEASASAATSGWRKVVVAHAARGNFLSDIAAPSKDDAWAVGSYGRPGPLIWHWNGRRWKSVRTSAPPSFFGSIVEAPTPNDVWIFGEVGATGLALHWNGFGWQNITLPIGARQSPGTVLGPADMWVQSEGRILYHWNGLSWQIIRPSQLFYELFAAGGHLLGLARTRYRPGNQTSVYVVYELTNGKWVRRLTLPRMQGGALTAADSIHDIWFWGEVARRHRVETLYHWTGSRLTSVVVPHGFDDVSYQAFVTDGHGGAWLGPALHWTGHGWVRPSLADVQGGVPSISLAAIPGTHSTWLASGAGRGRVQSYVAIDGPLP